MANTNFSVGGYQVHSVPTGLFALDGGAMFGTVPKVIWNKTNPADDKNRIDMEARAMLIVGHGRKILVDVGCGDSLKEKYGEKFATKFVDMYKLDRSKVNLEKSLQKHGLSFDDITDVILTHLHFDHAGGATIWKDGKLVPTFSKAKYYIQKRNFETANNPNVREKASYFKENFVPLKDTGVLEFIEGDKELFENISVISTFGHTEAQQLVKVEDSKECIIYGGDIIPMSAHIRVPFVMGYDLHPLTVIEEKKKILTYLAQKGGAVFFEHDPVMTAGRVEAEGPDFAVKEALSL